MSTDRGENRRATLKAWLRRLPRIGRSRQARNPENPFDTYEARLPSAQNCIDAIPGWVSAFPAEYGLKAGDFHAFSDTRIAWLIERFGPMAGLSVLELGPLEGGHTHMLHQNGASITAVEANKTAFLKCLVTKELLGLPRVKFLLGDCVAYLEQDQTRYDLIVACGVLYHMRDPLRFLTLVAARTDVLYLWTSFIDVDALEPRSELAAWFASRRERRDFNGFTATLYRLGYHGVNNNKDFCGGIFDTPRWMDRASILESLRTLGFDRLEIVHEDRPLPHQPCFSVFARRGN